MKNYQLNDSFTTRNCKKSPYEVPKCDVLDLEVQDNVAGILQGSDYYGGNTYSSKGMNDNSNDAFEDENNE
jgi:hypothetical protein